MTARLPMYSIKDLAELIGVDASTLHKRVRNAQEKPSAPSFHATKRSGVSTVRNVTLYDKAAFLAWHHKHYSHLEVQHDNR